MKAVADSSGLLQQSSSVNLLHAEPNQKNPKYLFAKARECFDVDHALQPFAERPRPPVVFESVEGRKHRSHDILGDIRRVGRL